MPSYPLRDGIRDPSASSGAGTGPIRVLIVEDRPVARKLLEDTFVSDDDLVVAAVARDGDEAIRLVREARPDVVLMDVVMPGKDGIQTLVEIRGFSEVPVILLTGAQIATESLEHVARRRGADGFFLKPSGSISLDLHTIHAPLSREIRRLAHAHRQIHSDVASDAAPSRAHTERDPGHVAGVGA